MSNMPGIGASSSSVNTQQSNTTSKQADSADTQEFSEAMEEKNNKKGDQKAEKGDQKAENPQDLMKTLKDSMMEVQGNNKQTQIEAMKAETAAIQKTNAADAADKINKIVDRVMVAEAGATKEVKVEFNKDFLPGTEVTIRKDGGKINIEFNTSSNDSFNFLSRGEQALAEGLKNKLGDNVSVDIQMQGGENDQPKDGRSRNEFITDEDQDEVEN